MKLTYKKENDKLIICLDGRLDTTTAPQLESVLNKVFQSTMNVELNCEKLQYVSSAGLRVLLWGTKKTKLENSVITLKSVSPDVMEVFAITGFDNLLNII